MPNYDEHVQTHVSEVCVMCVRVVVFTVSSWALRFTLPVSFLGGWLLETPASHNYKYNICEHRWLHMKGTCSQNDQASVNASSPSRRANAAETTAEATSAGPESARANVGCGAAVPAGALDDDAPLFMFCNTTPRSSSTCTMSLVSNTEHLFMARFFCFFLFFKSVATLLASLFNARCLSRSSLSASFSKSGRPASAAAATSAGPPTRLASLGSGPVVPEAAADMAQHNACAMLRLLCLRSLSLHVHLCSVALTHLPYHWTCLVASSVEDSTCYSATCSVRCILVWATTCER